MRTFAFGRETISDLRDSIWALKQDDGDTNLLVLKALELKQKLNESREKPQIELFNKLQQVTPLSSTAMLNLYRLIQEAIQNSIKHADASRITVTFSETEEALRIDIQDDGHGFDTDTVKPGNGLDIFSARCKELVAHFRQPRPG